MDQKEPAIRVLYCYMGKFPWYFPFFLKSCKHNPSIDFVIVSDQDEVVMNAPNIVFIKKTLAEISALSTKALGFDIDIKYAYKLCDIRVAFGVIFSDLFEGYDFWGYGDIDVIFGNIRNFYTNEILTTHDVFSGRESFLSGFLAIFRNTSFVNRLFERSKDYKLVFQSEKYYNMDEANFKFWKQRENKSIINVESEIESMSYVIKCMDAKGELKAFFDHLVIENTPGNMEWKNGHLFYNNKYEAMCYHLIQMKEQVYLIKPDWLRIPDLFYINEYFFSEHSQTSEIGKTEHTVNNKKIVSTISAKLEKLVSLSPTTFDKEIQKKLAHICGTYKSVFPSDLGDMHSLSIHVSICNDLLHIKLGDASPVALHSIDHEKYLIATSDMKAEILFKYDPPQITECISILPLGYLAPIILHKEKAGSNHAVANMK